MAVKSYIDEFSKHYERPQVDNLIVGFSGIDPQRKSSGDSGSSCACDNSTLSNEQKAIVSNLIHEALSVIDFSECKCDPAKLTDEQKSLISKLIEDKLNELDNCNCDSSSFSDEQKSLVKSIIDERLEELDFIFDGGIIDDGDDDDANPKPQPAPVNQGETDHELLDGLLGGDDNGHFHLKKEELLKLAAYPSDLCHENLPDLLGGNEKGHFHLDDNELKKLRVMIQTFFPDGSDYVIIKPGSPNPNDDDDDDSDPYGGLPSGTPPAWQINLLPSDYTIYSGFQKMFYGKHYSSPDSDELLVPLVYKNNSAQYALVRSASLIDWKNLILRNISNFGTSINDYFYDDNSKFFYFLDGSSSSGFKYRGQTSTGVIYAGKGYWNSVCFSPLLDLVLGASSKGEAVLVSGKTKNSSSYTHLTVNPACAAWHPTTAVFCLTGLEGTSTSYNGKTWTLNSDAPHNLRGLSYRDDLDSFVAWSGDDKTFYASPDGVQWQKISDTPIPLDNITAVHFEPKRQWFCAVGTGDANAYFSKDLKHWIPTKLRNNSAIDVGDVIFMPSTGLYVAMPTSGNYFYTFNPNNWTD